jgi:hypothetical protein
MTPSLDTAIDELAAKLAEALSRDATRELLLKEAQANCDESDELLDAQKAKLDALAPHGTCACSVDKPGDLCMHHSPQLVAANAEIARLTERNHKLSIDYIVALGEKSAALNEVARLKAENEVLRKLAADQREREFDDDTFR